MPADSLSYRGCLAGHSDWVTSLATTSSVPFLLVSSSRDKKILVWDLIPHSWESWDNVGRVQKSISGHSDCVSCVVLSNDGKYALSASWDQTVQLWELEPGESVRTFEGHTEDVFSVAISADNRKIVSGSRDKYIKLWNTLGECKYTIREDLHNDWVSCVVFSPKEDIFVSAGWDKMVKVWDLSTCKLRHNLEGHTGAVFSVSVSADGSLCASGGQDGTVKMWEIASGKYLYSFAASGTVTEVRFHPSRYWVCAATDTGVRVWDLEAKSRLCVLHPPFGRKGNGNAKGELWSVSVAWSADGKSLFAGATDGNIYVYGVDESGCGW